MGTLALRALEKDSGSLLDRVAEAHHVRNMCSVMIIRHLLRQFKGIGGVSDRSERKQELDMEVKPSQSH